MIRNYNCLSSRLDSWLKNGIGDASTSPPQQKSSRTTWLGAILLLLFTVFGANLQAQVTINETFDGATTPTGWTYASFARSTAAPCTGTASIRKNQWSSATTASAAAPLFTSNAQPLNISFSYKLVNYAATVTATTPALTNTVAWGSVITEVSIDGGTTYSITAGTINSTNHVVSQSCATQSYTVPGSSLPSGSSVRVRFRLTFAGTTPDYFVYMDNVSIVQVAPACSGTPVAGTSSPALQNICPGSTPAALSLTGATTGVTGLTYQWEQSTDGGSNYINVSTGTGATSASYTPAIFGGSTVLYRCKVTCSNSTEFAYSTAATVAPPATPATQVSNALVSAISTTGFTTSWTNGNGNRRLVLLSTAPITDPVDGSAVAYTANTVYAGGQQVVFDGTGTSVAVTGLSLGTTYYIKVYEYIRCGAGPFDYYYNSTNGTNSITAATCGAATIPYNESFETAVVPNFAACTVTSSHPLTRSTTATGAAPRTGTKYQNIRWTPTVAKYVYSAPLAFNGSTSYDMGAWYLTDGAAGWTTIKLFVNTAPTAVGATLLTTVSAANNTTYQKLMGTYVAPATGNYYSIIEVVHTSGPNDMSIDDLFAEATPTCTTPSALVVSSQNLSSATVSWTASTTTPANGYEYFYSTTNTAPTAGTTPSGAVAAGVTTATITGLAVDTNYFWWVRANCDGVDKSAWVAGSTIRLGYCIPVTSFGCTDGDVIARVTLNTLDNNSGTGCPSGLLGYSNYTADPALTTTLQAGSSYNCIVYAGQYSEGYAAWIDYNDDGNFDNATERIGFSNGQVAGSGVVGQLGSSASFPIAVSCNPPLGQHRLRVRAMFNTNGSAVLPCVNNSYGEIEDYVVTISAAVACPQPLALTATNATQVGATLSWSVGCEETAWEVAIQTIGSGVPTGSGVAVTATTYAATGLTAGTLYEYYVRGNCQGNGYSAWSGPYVFSPPACTTLVSPAQGQTGLTIAGGAAQLTWTAAAGATSYDVYLGTQAGTGALLGNIVGTTVGITGMLYATTYFWKIVPKNNSGDAVGCSEWSFTTEALPAFDICSGAIDLTPLTSPVTGATTGLTNNFGPTCGSTFTTDAPDAYYKITVPEGFTLSIRNTLNNYDTANSLLYGSCGSLTQVSCSDPDTAQVWTNNTGSTQTAYWIQDGWSSGAGTFTLAWTLTPPPTTITSFSPLEVCGSAGGQTVTITGLAFTGSTAVNFNGLAAASFTVVNNTTITAVLPAGVSSGIVTVVGPNTTGNSSATLTIKPVPTVADITGASSVCIPTSLTLQNATPLGTWSSSNLDVATVSAAGEVTPVSAGNVTISYAVTDLGCTTTKTQSVVVNAPIVLSNATVSQTVVTGNNTTFTVSATGTGNPTIGYQWQSSADGVEWTNIVASAVYSNETTNTLTITAAPAELNGTLYQCIVTGICGSVTSSPAFIVVGETGIDTQPADQTICDAGAGSASFTVVASADVTTYQWYEDQGGDNWTTISNGGIYSGATSATLSLSGLTIANNSWKYKCLVTGIVSVESNPATLTVVQSPSVTAAPANASVCSTGGSATFAVTASNASAYSWQYSTSASGPWANVANSTPAGVTYAGAATASLSVTTTAATPVASYFYQVVVSGISPCGTTTSASAELSINNPTISSQPAAASTVAGNTATFTAVTAAPGATYQWQRSATLAGTYANVVNATPANVTYTGTTSAALGVVTSPLMAASTANYYRVVVTSNGCSVTSTPAQLTVTNYCASGAGSTSTGDEDITNVTFGTLNNTTTCASLTGTQGTAAGTADIYSNFRAAVPAPSINAGQTIPISVQVTQCDGGTYSYQVNAYFDWNQNGVLTDAGESYVIWAYASGFTQTINSSIAVPATALAGNTIMRIVCKEAAITGPCQVASWGETEDYTISVIPAPVCTGSPVAGTITSPNSGVCAGSTAALTLSGYSAGVIGLNFQWYGRTLSGSFAAISGATSPTYTTAALTEASEYYCTVTCSTSSETATSPTFGVAVNLCEYAISKNAITYNSIMSTGTSYASLSSADDGKTDNISLAGTTFKYNGAAVTGFYATSNGWMTFNTTQTGSTYINNLTGTGQNNVLAPFWDDLVIQGNALANLNTSMKYKVIGTLGSGSADIVIEWAEMEKFSYADPNLNFQVVLHESDNSIDFNYGNMQLFNGATNNTSSGYWSYSVGMNGTSPGTASFLNRLILQYANSSNFGTANNTALKNSPDCSSQLRFVPAAATSSGAVPSIIPSNNEIANAIVIPVNSDPCASICGNVYNSRNATASAGMTACSAATPGTADDDVFFKFTTNSTITNYRIDVPASTNYRAVVQVLDASFVPVGCYNTATAGLTQAVASITLNTSSDYYLRIYDSASGAAGGASGSGEFGVCVSQILPPPAYDEPAGAIELTVSTSCTPVNSTTNEVLRCTATNGVQVCSATTAGTPDDDVWYKFTTPASTTNVAYTFRVQGVSTYNAVMQIFAGTPSSANALACVNATNNGGLESYSSTTLLPNTVYFVRVYHSGSGAANGNFNICVSAAAPSCVSAPTAPATASVNCASTAATTLSWAATASAATYDVYFDAGSSATTLVSADQTALSYNTSVLAPGSYTWKVVPKNAYATASACTEFTFTVNANVTYYLDNDGDGYGLQNVPQVSCTGAPAGYATIFGDCNDLLATVWRSGSFYVDADADGYSPSATPVTLCYGATTPVGYSVATLGLDCNDANALVWRSGSFYVDADGDGYSPNANATTLCYGASTPSGYAVNTLGSDCNDANPAMNATYTFYVDADGDSYGTGSPVVLCAVNANTPPSAGYSVNNTDCDDTIAAVNPGHVEVLYNGIDDNCDGQLDEGFQLTTNLQSVSCGATLPSMGSLIYANINNTASGYRFKVVNNTTGATQIINRSFHWFALNMLADYQYATTYTISVELQKAGIWLGYYGSACDVSSPAILSPTGALQVNPSQCGATLPSIGTVIATTPVSGATGYRFRVTDITAGATGANLVQVRDRSYHWFTLPMLSRFNYGSTYLVEVAVKTTAGYSGYGSACMVYTPAAPTLVNCGTIVPTASSLVYTSSLNSVSQYRFQVTKVSDQSTVTFDTNKFWFSFRVNVPGYTPETGYSVRVAVMTAGTWSPFGDACEIVSPAAAARGEEVGSSVFEAQAFPNPFTSEFKLNVATSTEGAVELKVYDMLGKLIETRSINTIDYISEDLGSAYPAGVYNVIVTQGENVKTLRVIKR